MSKTTLMNNISRAKKKLADITKKISQEPKKENDSSKRVLKQKNLSQKIQVPASLYSKLSEIEDIFQDYMDSKNNPNLKCRQKILSPYFKNLLPDQINTEACKRYETHRINDGKNHRLLRQSFHYYLQLSDLMIEIRKQYFIFQLPHLHEIGT